jgi:hypothetical protein
VFASRLAGELLAKHPRLPRRRATQAQVLEELRALTRQLVTATHGLSNQTAIVVGQIDELVERLEEA